MFRMDPRSAPRRAATISLLVLVAVAAVCGGDTDRPTDTVTVSIPPGARQTAADPGAECPEIGMWRTCSVEKRLERAGLVARRQEGEIRHRFLAVPGLAYRLGPDELHVFIYESAAARERDLAGVDSVRVERAGDSAAWPARPTLIQSNNLAAILIGGTARQVERVQDALIAGLPQP